MIYTNIQRIAAQQGMKIKEVEAAAGIPENTMNRWGKISPSVDKVASVAKVLGVTVEDLLEDTEEQNNDGTEADESV